MQSKFLLAIISGLFASGAVLAQTGAASPATPTSVAPAAGPSGSERATRTQERFAKFFVQLDQNGDGGISRDEAAKNPRLAQDFDAIDNNKDGSLDKDELRAQRQDRHEQYRRHATGGERAARFDARFKAADLDGDGALTKTEVEAAAGKWFDTMDANKDSKVTRNELRANRISRHKRS